MARGLKASQRTKYPGIGKAAILLGCSRVHLWMVLERKFDRKSMSLERRWLDFNRRHRWNGVDWITRRGVK